MWGGISPARYPASMKACKDPAPCKPLSHQTPAIVDPHCAIALRTMVRRDFSAPSRPFQGKQIEAAELRKDRLRGCEANSCGLGRCVAGKKENRSLASEPFGKPDRRQSPDRGIVARDKTRVRDARFDAAIDQHDSDAPRHRLGNGLADRPRRHCADDQAIDALRDHSFDVGFLLTRVIVGVKDGQPLDSFAEAGGGIFDGVNESDAPQIVHRGVGKADLEARSHVAARRAAPSRQDPIPWPPRSRQTAGRRSSREPRGGAQIVLPFERCGIRGDYRLSAGASLEVAARRLDQAFRRQSAARSDGSSRAARRSHPAASSLLTRPLCLARATSSAIAASTPLCCGLATALLPLVAPTIARDRWGKSSALSQILVSSAKMGLADLTPASYPWAQADAARDGRRSNSPRRRPFASEEAKMTSYLFRNVTSGTGSTTRNIPAKSSSRTIGSRRSRAGATRSRAKTPPRSSTGRVNS